MSINENYSISVGHHGAWVAVSPGQINTDQFLCFLGSVEPILQGVMDMTCYSFSAFLRDMVANGAKISLINCVHDLSTNY